MRWGQQVLEEVLEIQRRLRVRRIGRQGIDDAAEQLCLAVGEPAGVRRLEESLLGPTEDLGRTHRSPPSEAEILCAILSRGGDRVESGIGSAGKQKTRLVTNPQAAIVEV